MEATRAEQFLVVSRLLLDAPELDDVAAAVFLTMLDEFDAKWPLDAMAEAFAPLERLSPARREPRIVALLQEHAKWFVAAENVLKVWYSGQLARTMSTWVAAPPEAYLGALVWGLLDTQPQGVPGPFFGSWAYPPAGRVQ
jgi:hypothetical protein